MFFHTARLRIRLRKGYNGCQWEGTDRKGLRSEYNVHDPLSAPRPKPSISAVMFSVSE